MNAQQLQAQVNKSVEEQIKVFPCNNLRASNIGHPCPRYLYLLIKHWDEQTPHGATLQSIFNLGNKIEEFAIQTLKDAGFEVVTPTGNFKIQLRNGIVTGREDVRIKDRETGELIPTEIKGLNAMDWEKLNCMEDFLTSRKPHIRGYVAQLQVYLLKFEKPAGLFLLVNKQTGQLKFIDIPLDYDYAESVLSRGEYIYDCLADKTGNTIPDGCDDMATCQNCSLSHICTAPHNPVEADIDDGTIEEIIDRRESFREAKKHFEEADAELKSALGSKQKVITGKYLITANVISKKEYTVPAREERRIKVQRL